MPRIAQAPNLFIAALWVDLLRAEGLEASVQRQYLGSAAGELPPDQCRPEVWVADPAQEARAQALLDELRHMPQQRWHCRCGETVEGGFQVCWNCAAPMPR